MLMNDVGIEIPDFIPYSPLFKLEDMKQLRGKLCYILKYYPETGISMIVSRNDNNVAIRLADFSGNFIDPQNEQDQYVTQIMMEYSRKIILTMRLINIPKALFYFSSDNGIARLVDMRLSLNKFCGPGFLADIFGKQGIHIQERIGDPIQLDESNQKKLLDGIGDYSGGLVIKPSVFKFIVDGDKIHPMYGVVRYENIKTS